MPRGFHMGRPQFRPYTCEYHKIFAKSFKVLVTGDLGGYSLNVDWFGDGHRKFELKEKCGIRYMSFFISEKELQIALVLDSASASKKLYITCPYCQTKRQHLFAFKNGYACRGCLGLHYPCQSERKPDRLMRKVRKLRAQLWGNEFPDVYNMFDSVKHWPKPKWMRRKTFVRKRDYILYLEGQYWAVAMKQLGAQKSDFLIDFD